MLDLEAKEDNGSNPSETDDAKEAPAVAQADSDDEPIRRYALRLHVFEPTQTPLDSPGGRRITHATAQDSPSGTQAPSTGDHDRQ